MKDKSVFTIDNNYHYFFKLTGDDLKYLYLSTLLLSALSLHSLADSPSSMEQAPYAAACEAVQPESDLLKSLQQQLKQSPENRAGLIQQFWEKVQNQTTPIIEPLDQDHVRLIFLWKAAKHNVRLVGGPSNDHEWLTHLPDTEIWFKENIVNRRYIGSYSFAVDLPNLEGYLSNYCAHLNPELKEPRAQRRAVLQVLQLDPFNPKRWLKENTASKLRNENIIALDQAPPFIDPKRYPDHPQPELKRYQLSSQFLKNQRRVEIYQSKKTAQQSYITAIFFDGNEYAHLVDVPKVLDILVEQGKLPPIQAVFLHAPNSELRPKELTPNPKFSGFFNQEFLPWLDQKIVRDKQKTVLLGSSLGGLSAAYLALENPQHISHAVPLSGSFWWSPEPHSKINGMNQLIHNLKKQPQQYFHISANRYESSRTNNDLSILETSPIVAQALKSKGHEVRYQVYEGAHSYAIWQVILQDALLHFFANSKE